MTKSKPYTQQIWFIAIGFGFEFGLKLRPTSLFIRLQRANYEMLSRQTKSAQATHTPQHSSSLDKKPPQSTALQSTAGKQRPKIKMFSACPNAELQSFSELLA